MVDFLCSATAASSSGVADSIWSAAASRALPTCALHIGMATALVLIMPLAVLAFVLVRVVLRVFQLQTTSFSTQAAADFSPEEAAVCGDGDIEEPLSAGPSSHPDMHIRYREEVLDEEVVWKEEDSEGMLEPPRKKKTSSLHIPPPHSNLAAAPAFAALAVMLVDIASPTSIPVHVFLWHAACLLNTTAGYAAAASIHSAYKRIANHLVLASSAAATQSDHIATLDLSHQHDHCNFASSRRDSDIITADFIHQKTNNEEINTQSNPPLNQRTLDALAEEKMNTSQEQLIHHAHVLNNATMMLGVFYCLGVVPAIMDMVDVGSALTNLSSVPAREVLVISFLASRTLAQMIVAAIFCKYLFSRINDRIASTMGALNSLLSAAPDEHNQDVLHHEEIQPLLSSEIRSDSHLNNEDPSLEEKRMNSQQHHHNIEIQVVDEESLSPQVNISGTDRERHQLDLNGRSSQKAQTFPELHQNEERASNIQLNRKQDDCASSNENSSTKMNEDNLRKLNDVHEYKGKSEASKEEKKKKKKEQQSAFKGFWSKSAKLLPFLWPKGDFRLQMCVILCMFLLVAGRGVNLLVPIQYKLVVNDLASKLDVSNSSIASPLTPETTASTAASVASTVIHSLSENAFSPSPSPSPSSPSAILPNINNNSLTSNSNSNYDFPWSSILVFLLLKFLQGNGGFLSVLQAVIWVPVGHYTTREISIRMFEHLHNLSFRFHLNRKTGEILRALDKGTDSVVSLLDSMFLNLIPTLFDVIVAIAYLGASFDLPVGAMVAATMILYFILTVTLTEWRTSFRRNMNELDNKTRAHAVDSLLNFETVKCHAAEAYEVENFRNMFIEFQKSDLWNQLSYNILNLSQNIIISLGLLGGSLWTARRVLQQDLTVGDFVLFFSYVQQLYAPLVFVGNYYRTIQKNLVDMEKLFDLFKQQVEIHDLPGATPLILKDASVEFDNVCFSYDASGAALSNISFTIPPGQTYALVGPSGGGKTSLLRLLFRLYDPTSGRILIDGQDIKYVTCESLRSAIGLVPQDCMLFNRSIRFNIWYGKRTASNEEVVKAAKAACIHERIMQLPDGYASKVGERGLKLSGGEKQRVAIARTILKDPSIVVLDEATSALDTNTERLIQQSLQPLLQRTCLIIAHRLSTIVNADRILVLEKGTISEQGTHEELLRLNGTYYKLWMKQIEVSKERSESTNLQHLRAQPSPQSASFSSSSSPASESDAIPSSPIVDDERATQT